MPRGVVNAPTFLTATLTAAIERAGIEHTVNKRSDAWQSWRHVRGQERLSAKTADRIAIELLGEHPAMIWDDWLTEDVA